MGDVRQQTGPVNFPVDHVLLDVDLGGKLAVLEAYLRVVHAGGRLLGKPRPQANRHEPIECAPPDETEREIRECLAPG